MKDGEHTHDPIATTEDSAVCRTCGLVLDQGVCDYSEQRPRGQARAKSVYALVRPKLFGTYKALFHFNERMRQLCLQEPTIPSKLWRLIEVEFDFGDFERTYPDAERLTKEDVAKICGSITVPERYQEKFGSKKFLQKPLTSMKKFTEKWLTIKNKLGGGAPPTLHPNDVEQMQRDFVALLRPYNIYRHNPGCPGGPKCHKSPAKCRHNLPNYNYLILQLLRRRGKAELFRPYLPQLKTDSKIKALDRLCVKMWQYLQWEFQPVYQKKPRKTAARKEKKLKLMNTFSFKKRRCRRSARLAKKPPINYQV